MKICFKFQTVLLLLCFQVNVAQTGIGTTNPHNSSILELKSEVKGFLPPRMTTAQRNAIPNPAEGLMIYNLDKHTTEWYNGVIWFNSNEENLHYRTFPLNDGPAINPMKGWNSSWWNDYNYTSVGFQYLAWKDIETQNNVFNFQSVEDVMDRPGTIGRHVILRIYVDWFGENATPDAGPDWLYNNLGVHRLFNGTRYLTDFNNPTFIAQAVELIQAFGKQYNNDPRIYAIQLGILGYWGEWHNVTFNYNIENNTKEQILNAFLNSFPDKKIMGRYPWEQVLSNRTDIGFHNDFFGPFQHSYDFDTAIQTANKFLNGPIGGETPPDFNGNPTLINQVFETPLGEQMIRQGGYSTMGSPIDCNNLSNSHCTNFMKLHKLMGYNYQLTSGNFPDYMLNPSEQKVSVKLKNIGVAPIYYNWKVQFALINTANSNQVIQVKDVNANLKAILPQNEVILETTFNNLNTLNSGMYALALRIIQPGAELPKPTVWKLNPRNVYIQFSNDLPVIPAIWHTDNSLKGGWTILGSLIK